MRGKKARGGEAYRIGEETRGVERKETNQSSGEDRIRDQRKGRGDQAAGLCRTSKV